MDYSDYDRATTKLAEASAPQEKTFPEAVSFEGWEKESLKPNHWVVKRLVARRDASCNRESHLTELVP